MEQRIQRATYRAAVKMAMALSVVAVILAAFLDSTTDVSRTTLVLAVIVVGFVSSWVMTERIANAPRPIPITRSIRHRVTVLPAPHRVA